MLIPSCSFGLGICQLVSIPSFTHFSELETNHVEVNVVNDLVGNASIVLQDVVVLGTAGLGDPLRHGL